MIDEKDKKILSALDSNSRMSFKQIGKRTRISPETVRYRIRRMVEEGTIEKFLCIINGAILGYSYYQILLKLQNVDHRKKESIINHLKSDANVSWIAQIEGNYDIGFIVSVRDQIELQNFIEGFLGMFSSHIMQKTLSVNLKGEFLPRTYLTGKKVRSHREMSYEFGKETISLDEKDTLILKKLSKDGRTSAVDLARQVGLSGDTVARRIRDLERRDIILGHTVVVGQDKIGQAHVKLLIHTTNFSEERKRSFLSHIRSNPHVIAIIHTLAQWDYEIDLEIPSNSHLREFTMDITNEFSDIIRDYDALRIISMPKYSFHQTEH